MKSAVIVKIITVVVFARQKWRFNYYYYCFDLGIFLEIPVFLGVFVRVRFDALFTGLFFGRFRAQVLVWAQVRVREVRGFERKVFGI